MFVLIRGFSLCVFCGWNIDPVGVIYIANHCFVLGVTEWEGKMRDYRKKWSCKGFHLFLLYLIIFYLSDKIRCHFYNHFWVIYRTVDPYNSLSLSLSFSLSLTLYIYIAYYLKSMYLILSMIIWYEIKYFSISY